jgi:hypothetical protein
MTFFVSEKVRQSVERYMASMRLHAPEVGVVEEKPRGHVCGEGNCVRISNEPEVFIVGTELVRTPAIAQRLSVRERTPVVGEEQERPYDPAMRLRGLRARVYGEARLMVWP